MHCCPPTLSALPSPQDSVALKLEAQQTLIIKSEKIKTRFKPAVVDFSSESESDSDSDSDYIVDYVYDESDNIYNYTHRQTSFC